MKQRRNNSRILDDQKEGYATATNINDNVGVTVVMPKGEIFVNIISMRCEVIELDQGSWIRVSIKG
jgi:hypothetical protein